MSRLEDGLRDRAVGAAAADVAAQPFGNLVAVRIGIVTQERLGGHDLSRRAVTALRADVADERFLERIQAFVLRYAFDGKDRLFMCFERQVIAGAYRPAIDQHRTGTADFGFARALRSGEPQPIPKQFEQGLLNRDFAGPWFAVDAER